jgi:uncharacterized protein (DUF488 family)
MASFDLFSIGHSNVAAERFIAMLKHAGVTAVADVRSVPLSRRFPWFSKKNLAIRLAQEGIAYAAMGDTLGGRPTDGSLYCDGIADYEAMALRSEFRNSIDRLSADAPRTPISLWGGAREPLDCHRCLLVARSLAERGCVVGHILHDGAIEPHAVTEQRLLTLDGAGCDLFAAGQRERLAAAYRRRARAVAFRRKVPA